MTPPLPTNHPDLRLRVIERFARFCMNWAERLLCLEPLSRSTDTHQNAGQIGRPNFTIIAAITRLTAVAAMLMRYADNPRAIRRQTDARSGIHMAYGSFTEPNPGLPLGHDTLSQTVRTVCAKAHQMIRRDQFYRFGNPHYIGNKINPEIAPATDEPGTQNDNDADTVQSPAIPLWHCNPASLARSASARAHLKAPP